MEKFEVDLDTECIWFADAWRTRDDLAREIREKLEAGNYQIAQPSQAIEILTQAISQMRVLSVRVPAEMAEALEAAGQETGRSVNAVIRQLVDAWLSQDFDEGEVLDVEDAQVPADGDGATDPEDAPGEAAAERPADGEGALHVAEEKPSENAEEAEASWFSTGSGGSKKKKR